MVRLKPRPLRRGSFKNRDIFRLREQDFFRTNSTLPDLPLRGKDLSATGPPPPSENELMRYPPSFIDQVRLSSDIVPFIREDTALKDRGERLTGLCPFPGHAEKTPSFSVSRDRQVYYCFGCMKSGNIFTYLKEQRGMRFPEAVEYLARQAGLPLPSPNFQGQKIFQKSNTEELIKLNEKARDFYREQLKRAPSNHKVKVCLSERAYSGDTPQDFQLGYAPGGNALLKHLTEKERKGALRLGLLSKNERGEMYDTYRNRLIFPIISFQRRVIGFGARVLDDSQPKYINSRESDVFHKGQSFYGLNLSLRFLRRERSALIVEGYTDFISLWRGGIKNLTAVLGTALTRDQARLLKRYVDSVTLIFDGDSAGMKAAERSLPLLLSAGLEVKGVTLPEGQDPDQFIKTQGVDRLRALIQAGRDLFFHILREKVREMKDRGESFLFLINEIAPFLESVQKSALQALYKQRVLDIFGNDARSLSKELDRACQKIRKASEGKRAAPPADKTGLSLQNKTPSGATKPEGDEDRKESKPSPTSALPAERLLLALCLDSEDLFKQFLSLNGFQFLKTPWISDIFQSMEKTYRQNPDGFAKLLSSMMDRVSESRLLFRDSYIALKGKTTEPEKIFEDCLSFLKKDRDFTKANELVTEIKMTGGGDMNDLEKVFHLTKKRLNRQNRPVK